MLHIFLKKGRESKCLTQKEVAKKLGYTTPQFISNWENGVSLPPASATRVLENLYGAKKGEISELVARAKVKAAIKVINIEYGTSIGIDDVSELED